MNPQDNSDSPPPLRMGMQVPYTRKPFLGRLRGRLLTAIGNALLKSRIVHGGDQSGVFLGSNGGFIFQIKESSDATGGTSVLLQTNSVDNPNQTVLNLFAGQNITLSVDNTGKVTIDAAKVRGGYLGVWDAAFPGGYGAGDLVIFAGGVNATPGFYGSTKSLNVSQPGTNADWDFIAYLPASFDVCVDGASKHMVYNGLPPS